jgi:hypothetical protein
MHLSPCGKRNKKNLKIPGLLKKHLREIGEQMYKTFVSYNCIKQPFESRI